MIESGSGRDDVDDLTIPVNEIAKNVVSLPAVKKMFKVICNGGIDFIPGGPGYTGGLRVGLKAIRCIRNLRHDLFRCFLIYAVLFRQPVNIDFGRCFAFTRNGHGVLPPGAG